jgi:hypothetical protein
MVPFLAPSPVSHEGLETMRSEPSTVETLQEKTHGAQDILGLRNEGIPDAVVRPIPVSSQRFMLLLRSACASGAMLTERAASPPLSSSDD